MANPVRPAERLPAASRKQQIVETVLALIASQGIEAISFQLVADEIGVTQPAVLRHFPTKEALWLAVMDWLEHRLVAIYSSADRSDEAPLVALSEMFLAHVALIERYPALAKLVFSDHLRLQYPSLNMRFADIHRAYVARLRSILHRAKSDRVTSLATEPEDGAAMFLSLVQGLGFQFAIARLPGRFSQKAERLLALYLQGLTVEDAGDQAKAAIQAAKEKARPSESVASANGPSSGGGGDATGQDQRDGISAKDPVARGS